MRIIFIFLVFINLAAKAQIGGIDQKILDSSRFVIMQRDSIQPVKLSVNELNLIEEIFVDVLIIKNLSQTDFKKYRFQLFPFINDKGEKEIAFNCFCIGKSSTGPWKTEPQLPPEDGGSCHFGVTINLSSRVHHDFWVNGLG